MARSIVLLLSLTACGSEAVLGGKQNWDEATLRIVEPASGDFLALEDQHTFRAEITDAAGNPLPLDGVEIVWSASSDEAWTQTGAEFDDDTLAVGLQDVTAEVVLPNDDRLAHTIGGLLVQSRYAGTYSGLFNTNIAVQGYAAGCGGAVTLVVDPYGQVATGDATCVVSLMGFEMQAAYVFDLDNANGTITGTTALDLFGWDGLAFPSTGQLEPETGTLDLTFGVDPAVAQFIAVDGAVDADRVSREAGL